MKKILRALAALAALGFAAAIGWLVLRETGLVFHPEERPVPAPDPRFALHQVPVTFRAADSTRLAAWIVPSARADSTGFWLLICHGNLGNIGFGQRPEFYAMARDLGLNLLAFDYRGFGESDGAPSERGLYDDATAAYHFLTDSLRVPAKRIVIFGHSLGSGVAVDLASRVDAAALIVEGAYTSVVDRGQELYPYMPVRLVARNRFESIERIGRVSSPKLFLHSPEDAVIPYAHGQRLFAAAMEPKRFVPVRGGHEDAFRIDPGTYFGAIKDELRMLGAGTAAASVLR